MEGKGKGGKVRGRAEEAKEVKFASLTVTGMDARGRSIT